MIFGKTKLELKVGIFVFVGLIILTVFVLSVGKFRTLNSGYHVKFTFNFANGLKLGAPVRFAGIDVGEVKTIRFNYIPEASKTQVVLVCWVKNKIKIPNDSTIWVNTLGLLGEKYVEIMPGKDYGHYMLPGDALAGVDPIPMHEITQLAKNIADSVHESFKAINSKQGTIGKFIYDDSVYNQLDAFVTDLKNNPWKLLWKGEEKK